MEIMLIFFKNCYYFSMLRNIKKISSVLLLSLLTSFCSSCIKTTSDVKTIDIYASNDFHGRVEETYNSLGLIKFGSFFKMMGEKENTLLLDQGDTWQGSIYSNTNYGNLINDVMSLAKFDARTVGNHDFDWGLDKVKANTIRSYNDYLVPTLAANVYDYDFGTKRMGRIQQSDIGKATISYTLENGLKVGIVGVIGESQITSINSLYTQDIGFKDHIDVIKMEASKLREDGCDIVIASCHTPQSEVLNNNLNEYVDLVLCGHSHKVEDTKEGNLLFAQFGCNGENFGHIKLSYSPSKKKVVKTESEVLSARTIKYQLSEVDNEIKELVESSNAQVDVIASEVIANNVEGTFTSTDNLPNLMCKAIYDYCLAKGQDGIVLSYANQARSNMFPSEWTYADLYQSFPFDNKIYVIEATGKEILNEVAKYNYVYLSDSLVDNPVIDKNAKYKIAVLDYLAFHTNEKRYYDYFPTNSGKYITTFDVTYREILKNWLNNNGYGSGALLKARDYSSSLPHFDRESLM